MADCPVSFGLPDLGFSLHLASAGITYTAMILDSASPVLAPLISPLAAFVAMALARLHKKPKVKAPKAEPTKLATRPVGSEAQLEAVAKEAQADLDKLKLETVSLDLLQRKVNLLRSLEFMGSKSEGGAGAFKDPETAERVCAEAALVLATVNEKLASRGLKTVGLSIEGHSSADYGTAKEISLTRATSTKAAMHKALGSLEQEKGRSLNPVRLESFGFGCERPLAGLDDGGNHEANRRVEFRIIMEEDNEVTSSPARGSRVPCAWPPCCSSRG
jgi:hypothetical protein